MKIEEKIVSVVLRETGESRDDVFSESRLEDLVISRCVIAYFLRREEWSLKRVAKFMGMKSYTTVINMLKNVDYNVYETDELIRSIEIELDRPETRLVFTNGLSYDYVFNPNV